MTTQIAVLDDYAGVAVEVGDFNRLQNAEFTVFRDTLKDHNQLVERLKPFDVICIMRERTPFPAALFDALPNLKLLITTGPRNLSVDLAAASANDVVVSSTESRKTTTSELSMLMLLNLSRSFIPEFQAMNRSGWQESLGRDLHGLSLGVIGLGKIGLQMVNLGRAFGMEVHAWSPNLTAEKCSEHDVQFHADLPSLMAASDAVSVHMVLSERTQGLIGAEAFAAMRERAIFINTSRGPLADQQALLDGLKAGKPWKAGIDVYAEEPLPMDSPMRDKELCESGRLLLSPHLGYVTEQTWKIYYTQTVEAIEAWQGGSPIRVLNA